MAAEVREGSVVCVASVTNQRGSADSEFEKGEAEDSLTTLEVIQATIAGWRHACGSRPFE